VEKCHRKIAGEDQGSMATGTLTRKIAFALRIPSPKSAAFTSEDLARGARMAGNFLSGE